MKKSHLLALQAFGCAVRALTGSLRCNPRESEQYRRYVQPHLENMDRCIDHALEEGNKEEKEGQAG